MAPQNKTSDSLIPLSQLEPGRRARVSTVQGGRGLTQRLAALGVIPGTEVELVQTGFGGPVILRVRESRVILGHGMAHKVLVARIV